MSTNEIEVLTDEQLMAKFTKTQDARYFETIFARHHDGIKKFLLSRTGGDSHRADDLLQEVFLRALKFHEKAEGRPIEGWLVLIAMNCVNSDHERRTAKKRGGKRRSEIPISMLTRRREVEEDSNRDEDDIAHPVDSATGPHFAASLMEDRQRIKQHVAALPEPERVVIKAVYFDGLSHSEAAAHLHMPLGTLKSRFNRALGRLRDNFTATGAAAQAAG